MTELKSRIHDKSNGLDYVLVGDYYVPDLKLPEEHRPIGMWGRLHRTYLEQYRPTRFSALCLSGELHTYEQASREYINQMWAEAMEIYRSGNFRLRFSPAMNAYLKAHQKDFMPEDTKAGQILDYLERYSGSIVCSKQLYKEALGHDYDEPKQWELREINDIMNNAVTGWRAFSNPRYFPEPYRRQKGWERIRNDNEPDNSMDGFQEIPTEEMEQLGLPEEWLKQK